ncbi:hypothetical protein P3T35_005885 [Kitasatospora sp. GP30]|uniref:hypothetical protein n=1 Tax=Kitasatospora sp. GP30 TaxID=3035084 RepID=UPI000C713646|nr:hypothetical protein [Kitasatospora sp. GP30]MDH6143850.1 hypothetical protein [Kitasatospora sp. GP30]
MDDGDLDQAKAILTALPSPGEDPCVAEELAELDRQRDIAAKGVLEGQSYLHRGEPDRARYEFRRARRQDQANADAAAGLATVDRLRGHILPAAASNGQYFHDDWLSPAGRILLPAAIGILLLALVSSLASRVRPAAVAWPRWLLTSLGPLVARHPAPLAERSAAPRAAR